MQEQEKLEPELEDIGKTRQALKKGPKKNILVVFHGNSIRALLMKIFNISKEKISDFEIPTGNPLLIQFVENFKIKEYKYLNSKSAKKILFNI